ncbi:PKD domain-containing protein [Fulvivirga aurantia]|uniref:DUF7948 domain-containing protein n=1 Tax=Fulvivirga aurantia TaxID=2529383 RepID=UPI0016297842|nr:PKD domain-containing protein [Fulvivirga aurantia]
MLFCRVASADTPGIIFIENKGQWLTGALFGSDIPGGNFYITEYGFSYLMYDTEDIWNNHHNMHKTSDALSHDHAHEAGQESKLQMHMFHADFVNGNFDNVRPHRVRNTKYNYYFGNDQSDWVSAAKGYEQVKIDNLYPDIDLHLSSESWSLKYDLIVKPGACTEDIEINYRGVKNISLSNGNLVIQTSFNEIIENRPYAYQLINGKEVEVVCEYQLTGSKLSFDLPFGYDERYDLIIDPLLIFSTYSGSPADNWGNTATFGENGKLYSGGITNHFRNTEFLGEFPATEGAYQTDWAGVWDLAIIKYDSTGSDVEYATYLGGSGSEVPLSMIMNSKKELLILGVTNSTDFPTTTGAYESSFQGGSFISTILGVSFDNGSDSFVLKLSQDGSALEASTYFGGNGNDGLNDSDGALTKNYGDEQRGEIFIDNLDNIYIIGSTSSTDLFPSEINSFDSVYGGGLSDGFLVKFDDGLETVEWGGYLGGAGTDTGFAVKVDSKNDVFIAGGTNSSDFPVSDSSSIYNGNIDGWVARLNQDSVKINKSQFLGTTSYDQVYFLDIDSNDDVYLLGQTRGSYPVTGSVYNNPGGGQFLHKLTNDLDSTIFSLPFGSTGRREPNISPTAFLVNDCNNLYVAGWGNTQGNFRDDNYVRLSTNGLPTTTDALRSTTDGDDFYLFVLDADATSLLYATFFGGSDALVHVDGGTSRFDKSGIVYHSVCASCTGSSSFEVTDNAWSTQNGANGGCNNAAFKFDLASLRAVLQTNNTALTQPGYKTVCLPDSIVFQNLSIGGEMYKWQFGDGQEITTAEKIDITYQYGSAGRYEVVLTAFDPNTCTAQDVTSTVVDVFDPIHRAGDDAVICVGEEFRLTASGGLNYFWISDDSTFTSDLVRPIVQPSDTTSYFVEISDANCTTLDTLTVDVIPEVNFDYDIEKVHDCKSRPDLKLINRDTTASYTWHLGDGTTSDLLEFTHSYKKDGSYSVQLIGKNGKCVYQRDSTVSMVTVKVPNVFTPGDGHPNGTFEIISSTQEDLRIYNRWGRLVYESDDYQDDWTAEEVPGGVYYYEVDIENETICTGWVQVFN